MTRHFFDEGKIIKVVIIATKFCRTAHVLLKATLHEEHRQCRKYTHIKYACMCCVIEIALNWTSFKRKHITCCTVQRIISAITLVPLFCSYHSCLFFFFCCCCLFCFSWLWWEGNEPLPILALQLLTFDYDHSIVVGLRQSRTTMESALGGFTACGATMTMAEQANAGV